MALQECGLNLNRGLKELQSHGTLDFPCAGYASLHTDKLTDAIPWHWHEEIEIIYMEEGQMELKTSLQSFFLKKGDCIAMNSNILHYGEAVNYCKLRSLVFHPILLTGSNTSAFARKYILPLVSCDSFSGYFMGNQREITSCFHNAFEALVQENSGFEFTVRDNLSHICFFLYEQFECELAVQNTIQSQDNLRIKKMLEYIHENFTDEISLTEIAKAANIGERECLRCFRKTIQFSPIQYLLKYRITQGGEMLLNNPEKSISEIAASCGFDSPSNFAKLFKRFYLCTPREYRILSQRR